MLYLIIFTCTHWATNFSMKSQFFHTLCNAFFFLFQSWVKFHHGAELTLGLDPDGSLFTFWPFVPFILLLDPHQQKPVIYTQWIYDCSKVIFLFVGLFEVKKKSIRGIRAFLFPKDIYFQFKSTNIQWVNIQIFVLNITLNERHYLGSGGIFFLISTLRIK